MVTQTHTVTTDALATLGTIIDESAARDAIHLAVEPIEAHHKLYPGQHVGINQDGKASSDDVKLVGIVDPFLLGPVFPGQRFWLVVYPRQISSLRHVWEHPAFPASDAEKVAPAEPKLSAKEVSEAWLRSFIANADCPSYETVIAAAIGEGAEQWSDEYLHFSGLDAHGDIPPEFWDHVEVVTGQKITRRPEYFSCGC